ncbi:conserved hypothetical protein [Sporisorium reilianum SRZ2]|uniref:Zn(2)-C6 fungal-type domain-containing protein n=1 Tax=Sporisorium reilianum (strain SRZ2) TaxID=999809 RepID=E7A041_SPORE|nr:conserved hypothetical protein [Sporisorium reilianum SRZ2]
MAMCDFMQSLSGLGHASDNVSSHDYAHGASSDWAQAQASLARKVRCDERLPKCTNCARADVECVTDDPRKPHLASVERKRASSTVSRVAVIATEPPITHASPSSSSPAANGQQHPQTAAAATTSKWADPTWMRNALGSASASIISDSQAQDRFKYVGSSNLQVFSHWVDLLLAKQRAAHDHTQRQAPHTPISDHFDHGRIHSEEYNFALPLFPVFDDEVLRRDAVRFVHQYRLDDAASMQLDEMTPYDTPLLATIYTVTATSLLDASPRQPDAVKVYLDAAYSLYGHVIGVPYLASVQALLLLHLALRARSKDGAAWQPLSSAIRIAYSIGLHRAPPSPPLHSAALDSGRPSMIRDVDSEIHTRLYTSRSACVDEAALFSTLAQLDQKLVDWSSSTLTSLSLTTLSGEEAMRGVSRTRDLQVLHLLCTYHFTLINVHRASVMLDTRLYRHHVSSRLTRHWAERLLCAEAICRRSARAIVRCIHQYLRLHTCPARMISGTIALSAVYVLAICILKHPRAASVQADLALVDALARTAQRDYALDGMPTGFTGIFGALQRLARQCVRSGGSRPPSPSPPVGMQQERHAHVSLQPFWMSLGFGRVLSGDVQHAAQLPAETAAQGAPHTAPAASLLPVHLDAPDDLLSSLLGLPDFFTPLVDDDAAAAAAIDF